MLLKYLLRHFNCFSRRAIHLTVYTRQLEIEADHSQLTLQSGLFTRPLHWNHSCQDHWWLSPGWVLRQWPIIILLFSGGLSTTDHSLFPKQVLYLAFKIPSFSCFPSKSLLSWSPQLSSSLLLDLKIFKFLKPQSWTSFSICILCHMISNQTC